MEICLRYTIDKEMCEGPEEEGEDCGECIAHELAWLPCTVRSNSEQKQIYINPEKLRWEKCHNRVLNRAKCKQKNPEICKQCLQEYFKAERPCVAIAEAVQ